MQIVKSKTLCAVEPNTKYMGCTLYLEGPHCLDSCVFDNCSFRNELHYVKDFKNSYDDPKFSNCSFTENITVEYTVGKVLLSKKDSLDILNAHAENMVVKPIRGRQKRLKIEIDLPKIKTINLSKYKLYSKVPIHWFEQFPTLEKVILPDNTSLHLTLKDEGFEVWRRYRFNGKYERELTRINGLRTDDDAKKKIS